jgi:hypothetical protein
MKLNIIHLPHRTDRFELLQKELASQGITDYQIWNGIMDAELPARGISRAHKQIVRDAADKGLPEVLIGEDDLHFTGRGAFDFYLNHKPRNFDLYLGGIYHGDIDRDGITRDFSGLTLYMVSSRYYQKFLDSAEDKHIDRFQTNRGRFVVCQPCIVQQHDGFSDNVKKTVEYGSFLKGKTFFTGEGNPPITIR